DVPELVEPVAESGNMEEIALVVIKHSRSGLCLECHGSALLLAGCDCSGVVDGALNDTSGVDQSCATGHAVCDQMRLAFARPPDVSTNGIVLGVVVGMCARGIANGVLVPDKVRLSVGALAGKSGVHQLLDAVPLLELAASRHAGRIGTAVHVNEVRTGKLIQQRQLRPCARRESAEHLAIVG